MDAILGDLRDAKNQKGVAVLEDTVGNTMKKVTIVLITFLREKPEISRGFAI